MDTRWIDPEVDGIFEGDPELTELAHRVRAARPEPVLDPRFQAVLRAQLMREAPAALGSPAAPARVPRPVHVRAERMRSDRWWRRPGRFAWAGAGLGVALAAAATVVTVSRPPLQDHQVTAMSPVAQLHAVSPDNVITVAFSQPMNQSAVVGGLHIRPATAVTTAWRGNDLLITPTHHLAGNTPYTVTIDRNAAQPVRGQPPTSDIHISFGTAPVPPSVPSVAQLSTQTLGPVSNNSQVLAGGDGTVIATSSTAPVSGPSPAPAGTPSPSVSPSPSSRPSGSPSASPSPTPSPSPSASSSPSASDSPQPSAGGKTLAFSANGNVIDLGPSASWAALSPNGLQLIAAVPSGSSTQIVLVPQHGSNRTMLTSLASSVVATGWLANDTAVVAETDRIISVDLLGHVRTLTTLPSGTRSVVFAPSGGYAFAGSTTQDGQLINLAGNDTRPLPGSRDSAAFSGDGAMVAWIDGTGSSARLVTTPVSRQAADSVPLNHPGDSITDLALDQNGTHVALVDHPQSGTPELQVVALPSGTVIAKGPPARELVFSPRGNRLLFVSGGQLQTAALPGTTWAPVNSLPDGAAGALQAFVDAQVSGDAKVLGALADPSVNAASATPHGLTRGYVVSNVANPDGTVGATARLIIDPSAAQPVASFVDETLTLSAGQGHGGGYLISALNVNPPHEEPVGPHVVSVSPSASAKKLVLRVVFDSDLREASVGGAISVTTAAGRTLPATTAYDANSRTATVTVDVNASTPVKVSVATSLVDVDGQAMASGFTVNAGG
ncbi:MAG: Ig-like domain-containing protein [Candidatus Dormibacteraeota bacterium]|uniref:Ig-like domain-containing protein n=1 Tax=Candidatus Amunia macphersoniae TaxID=3127014 RepID=A0A934KQ98_9BACT|nr:Ig-like domain-containing protein [Candidatus Dormibacteraeota bacterium]